MATFTFNYLPFGIVIPNSIYLDMFTAGATPVTSGPFASSSTQWSMLRTDGLVLVATGTSLTYDGSNVVNGGSITGFALYEATDTSMTSPVATITSLIPWDAAGFGAIYPFPSFSVSASAAAWNYVLPGDDAASIAAGTAVIHGGVGNDTLNLNLANTGGFVRPGPGNDTINFGAGTSYLVYDGDFGGYTTSGISINLNSSSVTDPWGGTDNWTGTVRNIRTTQMNDTIIGNGAGDTFEALGGNNSITGGAGFDWLRYSYDDSYAGFSGGVSINLNTGTGTNSFGGTDTFSSIEAVVGGIGNDTLTSSNTPITVSGFIYYLSGGLGSDSLVGGSQNTLLRPGSGNDSIVGGAATGDRLSYLDYMGGGGITIDLGSGSVVDPWGGTDTFSGIEAFEGTYNADSITGGAGTIYIAGLGGNDTIDAGAGNAVLGYNFDATYGGLAAVNVNLSTGVATDGFGATDQIIGFRVVRGTLGNDTFVGNNNGNTFQTWGGNNSITGGTGADTLDYSADVIGGGNTPVVVSLGLGTATNSFGGTDTFTSIERAIGTSGNDTLNGNAGSNTLTGGGGNDLLRGSGGNDSLVGGNGNDVVDYSRDASNGGASAVSVNLQTGIATDGFGATDNLSGIEVVAGTAGNDTFVANANGSSFRGLGGNDSLTGSTGLDTADYSADAAAGGTGAVTVNLQTGTATDGFGATDTLQSIERATGTAGNDSLVAGNAGLNGSYYVLTGNAGNDTLAGGSNAQQGTQFAPGSGNNSIQGGAANNDRLDYSEYNGSNGLTIDLTSGTLTSPFGGTDTFSSIEQVRATRNADNLTGTSGANHFFGLAGNDTITGNGGNDFVRYDQDANFGGNQSVVVNLQTGVATDGFGNTDQLVGIRSMRGTSGGDTVNGSNSGGSIAGLGGGDFMVGGTGFDWLDYGSDAANGGAAGVTVNLETGTATDGFGATDLFNSFEGVQGTTGNDSLTAGSIGIANIGSGFYQLNGDAGNDTMVGSSNAQQGTVFVPGSGNNSIQGGAALNDRLDYAQYAGASGLVLDMSSGSATNPFGGTDTFTGIEDVRGTKNADHLTGTSGNNLFFGLAGNDTIVGNGGSDAVYYNNDADFGGAGAVNVNLLTGVATDGFGNTDSLTGIRRIRGTSGADTFVGDGWGNTFQGVGGADSITGGSGYDYLDYRADGFSGGNGPVNIDLSAGTGTDGSGATDTFSAIEGVYGTAGNDTLTSGTTIFEINGHKHYILSGGAGNDLMVGSTVGTVFMAGEGQNTLTGGSSQHDRIDYSEYTGNLGIVFSLSNTWFASVFGGADYFSGIEEVKGTKNADAITGTNGNNVFFGLAGNDSLDGFGGIDTVRYDHDVDFGGASGVIVNLGTGVATDGFGNQDSLTAISNVRGTNFGDDLTGSTGANIFILGNGFNEISGGGGADIADYSNVDGPVTAYLGSGVVHHGVATDQIANVPHIVGSSFNDTLIGWQASLGANSLTGGAGADRFVLLDGGGNDVIRDFQQGQSDKIDLSAFVEIQSLSDVQARATADGGDTVLDLGDGDIIRIVNMAPENLGSGDFIFAPASPAAVSVTIATASGYDATTFYTDMSESTPTGVAVGTHFMTANAGKGLVFDVKGVGFTYSFLGGDFDVASGTVTSIDVLDNSSNLLMSLTDLSINATLFVRAIMAHSESGDSTLLDWLFATRPYSVTGNSGPDLFTGGDRGDTVSGGNGDDVVYGGSGGDSVLGGVGVDWVYGGQDGDSIDGGDNTDALFGEAGNDTILGGNGDDGADGGDGNDSIGGGAGADWLYGGLGSDTIDGAASVNALFGQGGNDSMIAGDDGNSMDGGSENDTLSGGAGTDWLFGGADNDSVSGGAGGDMLFGGEGNDSLDGAAGINALFGENGNGVLTAGDDGNSIDGGAGADTITGGTGVDWLYAGTGNNSLDGAGGNDALFGDTGDDVIVGGLGDDGVSGGGGNDTMSGDGGVDWLFGGTGNDSLSGGSGLNALFGQAGHDTMTVGDDGNNLDGGDGNDVLTGGNGVDWLYGGADSDTLTGGGGGDALFGEDANDSLTGGSGDDGLDGGYGDDTMDGGVGSDRLTGYSGADVFATHLNSADADLVMDFETGVDKIGIIGAEFGLTPGALDFAFETGNGLPGSLAAASATFYYDQTGRGLWWDPTGGATGDLVHVAGINAGIISNINDFKVI